MDSVLQSPAPSTLITRNPRTAFGLLLMLWLGALLPVARLGFTLDDLVQRQILMSNATDWWRTLFVFLTGQAAAANVQILAYGLPWWTDTDVKIAFFRPLAAATHWLDYRLWPESIVLIHLHSVLWYGVLCALAFALYRRLLPTGVALLAGLLFVVDIQHMATISWIASRNGLIAGSFSLLAMLLHWRAIQIQGLSLSWLAAVSMLLALLAGEVGSACAGYLLGMSLFVDRRALTVRLTSLLPFGVLGGGWLLYYFGNGYGSANTGFYNGFTSGEPLQALVRLPFMAAIFIGGVPSQFWPQNLFGPAIDALVVITIMVIAAIWLLRPVLPNPIARCLLLGALVALLPVANSAATERNLLMFSIGGHGVLALVLMHWWRSRRLSSTAAGLVRLRGALCWVLVAVHLVLSPLAFLVVGQTFLKGADNPHPQARASKMENAKAAVVLRAPTTFTVPTIAMQRRYLDLPTPATIYVLASSDDDVVLARKDLHSVEVSVQKEHDSVGARLDLLFRNTPSRSLHAGDEVRHGEMVVQLAEMDKYGMPKKFVARFDQPLENYQWLNWSKAQPGLVPVDVPANVPGV